MLRINYFHPIDIVLRHSPISAPGPDTSGAKTGGSKKKNFLGLCLPANSGPPSAGKYLRQRRSATSVDLGFKVSREGKK